MINTFDLIGASLSLISGYFYIKEKPVAWIISLLAIPFDIAMDISIGVYADLLLQLIYFVLLLYGWYCWRHGTQKNDDLLPIKKMRGHQIAISVPTALFPISIVWLLLTVYTDSTVALFDASMTVLSLIAQWLLCRKIIQSWLLWVLADALYVGLYATKQMPFHMVMSFFDAIICVIGYVCWVREFSATTEQLAEGLVTE